MALKPSGEMYLETIYILGNSGAVRSIDVADRMGFSKPSVSRAVARLKKDGFITVDDGGFISLTESGKAAAEKVFERHTVLSSVLIRLGVDEATAHEDACKIEHIISDKTFEALKKHISSN